MAETIQYKCPCCGGRLEFDSGLQKMKCPYCDTTFDVETLEGYDDALKQDAKDDMHWDAAQQPWDDAQMGVYTCKSCGGELVCDESTAATACPFCGNPIVLTGQPVRRPEARLRHSLQARQKGGRGRPAQPYAGQAPAAESVPQRKPHLRGQGRVCAVLAV